jgi:hypothetical protein
VRVEGRPFVYGFLLLRVPLDGPLESSLASLGVRLLGPHDDHQKVRVPVESLEAVAGLTEVESLGVSLPEQKLSLELADVHAARTDGTAASTAAGIPIVINLFEEDGNGSFRRQLEGPRGHGRGVRPCPPFLSRGGYGRRPSTGSSPSTSCSSSS